MSVMEGILNTTEALGLLGLSMPTPAYLAGLLLFSILGYAAYRHGKKAERPVVRWGGIALMLYSYAVSATWALYVVGAGICLVIYVFHDR